LQRREEGFVDGLDGGSGAGDQAAALQRQVLDQKVDVVEVGGDVEWGVQFVVLGRGHGLVFLQDVEELH